MSIFISSGDNIAIYAYTTAGANGEELPKPPISFPPLIPFPATWRSVLSSNPAQAELAVYNLRGQKLRDLSSASYGPGKHSDLGREGPWEPGSRRNLSAQAARRGLETAFKKISKY